MDTFNYNFKYLICTLRDEKRKEIFYFIESRLIKQNDYIEVATAYAKGLLILTIVSIRNASVLNNIFSYVISFNNKVNMTDEILGIVGKILFALTGHIGTINGTSELDVLTIYNAEKEIKRLYNKYCHLSLEFNQLYTWHMM